MGDKELETVLTTFFENDHEGNVQEVCMETGDIIRRAENVQALLTNPNPQKALNVKSILWNYHEAYGQLIAKLVAEGETVTAISEKAGFPPGHVISRWKAQHEVFKDMMEQAYKARAETRADIIMKDAEDDHDSSKDDMQQRKLKFERLKWGAAKDDPDKYGDRTKVSGDSNAPLEIVVSTGIIRKPKVEE